MPKLSIAKLLAAKMGTKAEAQALLKEPHILFTTAKPQHAVTGEVLKPFEAAQKLKEMGEDVKVVRGVYGQKEPSILVSNPKNSDAIIDMAKKHGQDSLYSSTGKENQLIQLHDNPKTGLKANQVVVGQGQSISDKVPEDFYTKIKTKEGPVAYQGNLDFSAPPMRGVKHYGPEGITVADPSKAGSGLDAMKTMKYGKDSNPTTQFYNITDPKEAGVMGTRYVGAIPEASIYNPSTDAKNLITKEKIAAQMEKGAARDADAIKGAMREGGVESFERPLGGEQKVIESFNKVPLTKMAAVAPMAAINSDFKLPSWEQAKAYMQNPAVAAQAIAAKMRGGLADIDRGAEEATNDLAKQNVKMIGNVDKSKNFVEGTPEYDQAIEKQKEDLEGAMSFASSVGSIGKVGKFAKNLADPKAANKIASSMEKGLNAAQELQAAKPSKFGKVITVSDRPMTTGKVIMADGKPSLTSYVQKVEEAKAPKTAAEIVEERLKAKGLK